MWLPAGRSNADIAAPASPAGYPIRLGTEAEFACVRTFLASIPFGDAEVCAALKLASIAALFDGLPARPDLAAVPPRLRWCVEVFVLGRAADAAESRAVCGEDVIAACLALGLLRPVRAHPERLVSPVWLHPAFDIPIVTDRRSDPDESVYVPAEDEIFPACFPGTLHYLGMLSAPTGLDALDLCGGSGVGAIHFARTAAFAATTDVTPRAAFFAAFNAALNGVKVASFCGDMYAPLDGRQFDLIAAHPPYAPSVGRLSIARHGGVAGEDVIRRAVEGLPRHLRVGGLAMIVGRGYDREGRRFEERAREWLGEAAPDFDILFGLGTAHTIEDIVESFGQTGSKDASASPATLGERLRALAIEQFVFGVLMFSREREPVTQPPQRLEISERTRADDFRPLFARRRAARQPRGWS
jgi:methylase of polypeptide subunit release factors